MYNNTKQLNEDISDYLAISKDNNIQLFESISRRDSTYTIVYVDLYNDRIMTSNTDNEGVRHMKKMFPDENSKAKVFKNIEKRAIAAYKKQLEEEGYDIINESISRRDSTYTIVYVDLYNDRIMTSNTDNEGVRHMKKMFPDENSKAKVFKNIEKRAIAAYKKQLEEEGYDIINESTQNTVGMAVGGGAVLATVVAKVTSEYKKLAAKESPASFKARKKLLLEALQAAINEVQNATA